MNFITQRLACFLVHSDLSICTPFKFNLTLSPCYNLQYWGRNCDINVFITFTRNPFFWRYHLKMIQTKANAYTRCLWHRCSLANFRTPRVSRQAGRFVNQRKLKIKKLSHQFYNTNLGYTSSMSSHLFHLTNIAREICKLG